jgi:galactoside O-acetyltransferase
LASRAITSFLTEEELADVGFGSLGREVQVSRFAHIYRAERVYLGDNVRIDDFAIISPGAGQIRLHGFNHIATGGLLFGTVTMCQQSTISSRTAIYAHSDDFTVDAVTYPGARDEERRLIDVPTTIGSRVVIGSGSTVLPGADVAAGISVGAMSLVNRPLTVPGVYAGIPVRYLRARQSL